MKLHFLLAAALVTAASAASAQSMKPGLWEITSKMQSGSGQMERQMAQAQQQMANMPPDQRKMMEDMMARQGMKMGTAGGGAMTMKVCMTKEMVERNEMPSQQRGNCQTTQQSRSGNTMKMAFACTNPPSNGEGQFTFNGSEGYTMKMAVNTTVQGKPETMNMDATGKWLGADCGDVKPRGLPKQ
ncbi:MAG: DUF3617 domain-containing protein [Ramlibacter sp.]